MPTSPLKHILFVCALVLLSARSSATPWLVSDFRAVYEAHVGIARGETELELRALGDGLFEVQSRTRLKGLLSLFKRGSIHELSRFRYEDGEIRALSFERSDDISREERSVRITYDWTTQTGVVEHQGAQHTTPLEAGTTNTLLMQIALMQDLRADRRIPRYYILDHNGLLPFDVTYYGDEPRIEALDRQYDGLRYSHSRPDSGTTTTFWAPRDLGYLPAQCEIIKHDKLRGKLKLLSFSVL